MSREMKTKYRNEMNTIDLTGLTALERDMFFTLCSVVKDTGATKITLGYDKLREKSGFDNTTDGVKKFHEALRITNRKLSRQIVEFVESDTGAEVMFVIFHTFKRDLKSQTLTIQVNEMFEFLLNDFAGGNFTKFELQEFINLVGIYTKDIYRYLKQFRSNGIWHIRLDDFRDKLGVPESYKMIDIDKKVLGINKGKHIKGKALDQLSKCFKNLRLEKVKSNKRGNPVTHLKFHFEPEDLKPERSPYRDKSENFYYEPLIDADEMPNPTPTLEEIEAMERLREKIKNQ